MTSEEATESLAGFLHARGNYQNDDIRLERPNGQNIRHRLTTNDADLHLLVVHAFIPMRVWGYWWQSSCKQFFPPRFRPFGIELLISDAHEGLKAARKAVFPSVPRQSMKREVAEAIRGVFNALNREEAKRQLDLLIKTYQDKAPKLASWAANAIPEALTVFGFPEAHRRRLRTSNMVERLNKELKRRTRVATLFPNEASCLRLVSAVAMEISDEWETGRIYLTMEQ